MGSRGCLGLFKCMVAFVRSAWPMRLSGTMKSSGIVNQLEWIIWTRHVWVPQLNRSSLMIWRQTIFLLRDIFCRTRKTFPAQNLGSTHLWEAIFLFNITKQYYVYNKGLGSMHLLHVWSSSILLSLTTLPVWQDAWACRQTCSSWRFCWPSLPSNPTPGPHCLDSYPPPPSWPSSYQHPGCSSSHQMNYMNSFSNSPSSNFSFTMGASPKISERLFSDFVSYLFTNFMNWDLFHLL